MDGLTLQAERDEKAQRVESRRVQRAQRGAGGPQMRVMILEEASEEMDPGRASR